MILEGIAIDEIKKLNSWMEFLEVFRIKTKKIPIKITIERFLKAASEELLKDYHKKKLL